MKKITKKSISDSLKSRSYVSTNKEHEAIVKCFSENEKESCETKKEYINRIYNILN